MRRLSAIILLAAALAAATAIGAVGVRPLPRGAAKKKSSAEKNPLRPVERSREVITAFFKCRSVEEMADYVRQPERALPRMKAWYAGKRIEPLKITFGDDWREVEMGRSLMVLTSVDIDFRETSLVTEVPRTGSALFDWESYAAWCEIPWIEFTRKGTPAPRVFRVIARVSDYFNFRYSDEKKLACFQITDNADEVSVYAYCDRDSDLHRKIKAGLRDYELDEEDRDKTPAACMLKLSMADGDIARRQAKIEEFIASGWVEP